MKLSINAWTVLILLACVPMVVFLLQRRSAQRPVPVVRFATFNASLQRDQPGALLAELRGGGCEQAKKIAAIVQHQEIDVLLVCELDRDATAEAARVFADEYLAVGQLGQKGREFPHRFTGEVNTGEPSGLDLDGDGKTDGPGDAFGFGRFPGQYGMALFSRYPIRREQVRTFRKMAWSAMPGPLRPEGFWPDATWQALRLSSKSHWDVPVQLLEGGFTVHVLCSHPTPPAFDGPEDRNGRRNHDEIRFWADYLVPGKDGWIQDDAGGKGGLPDGAHAVVMGDLNCDPVDGDAVPGAIAQLLQLPRLQDPAPRSDGAVLAAQQQWGANSTQRGQAALDTGDFEDAPGKGPGNLRIDYVLPTRSLAVDGAGVFWPQPKAWGGDLVTASDHRLVWVDVRVP